MGGGGATFASRLAKIQLYLLAENRIAKWSLSFVDQVTFY